MAKYKRGTIVKDGKTYGYYPDGSLYRIYNIDDTPWMQFVDVEGETKLRVRQATELGYAECPVNGCVDLAYPSSTIRRARTVGEGRLVNALTCGQQLHVLVEL